jgi:hypothetical protein
VPEHQQSQPDRTSAVVTAGLLLLAVLGVATVFHEPIAALLAPADPGESSAHDPARR